MQHLGSLVGAMPLPALDLEAGDGARPGALPLAPELESVAQQLAGDLPAGHLHVWGGPAGAGKTSLLLSLLHGVASRGRPVVYATYDLHPSTLAMRALAMLADVDVDLLPDPGGRPNSKLDGADAQAVARVAAILKTLPFYVLPARGFSVDALADRVVRAPVRPQVLVVDYIQAVVRDARNGNDAPGGGGKSGTALGATLRDLSALATRLHLAMVCVFRSGPLTPSNVEIDGVADRVGWIAPDPVEGASRSPGARRVEILRNRYGERASMPLRLSGSSGRLAPTERTRTSTQEASSDEGASPAGA